MRFGSMHVLQVIMESLEIISNYIISSRLNYNNALICIMLIHRIQFLRHTHRNLKYTSQNKTLFSILFIRNDFLFRFLQPNEIS